MAEKRKLHARDRRDPPAKRRVSEAITENSRRRKKSTPSVVTHASTPAVEPEPQRQATPEPIEEPLPTKIKDGEPLPTRATAQQSLTLSDKEYQSFAESAILSMSLERSKKKWLSDGIFERYWTKPKKTKREQLEGKNPPKDSMTKIGSCKIIIEPHHFDGMIYTIKDPNAKPTVQITPPQRHIIHYGPPGPPQPHPGYQYQHYTPPPQQMRPPPYAYNQPLNPQHTAPHRPPPPQQPVPRQLPPNAQGPPPQIAKPSPDPVIQMLATRAASDPELKALMKIVASSKASQEQLRVFQGHIDELNAIIRQRERQQQQQQQQNHHQQQYRQSPRPDTIANPSIPSSAPQHVAQPSPQQNIATSAPSTPAPSSSHVTPSNSTPVPIPKNPESSRSSQSTSKSQPPPEVASPASNSVQSQTQQTASSTIQSTSSAIEAPTPKAAPSIKTEPGRTTPLSSAPASVVPTVNPPNSAPQPVAPMQATQSLPVPTQMSPALSPAAGSTTSTPLPYNGIKASPAPNYIPHNQSPQPLSPYPPAAPQYPLYHQPYPGPPPIKARGAPPNYGPANTYYQSAPAPPPPKPPIKGVVFEFTSPLTPYGSSTSGHAGSGDRYLFPEYAILEYKAGGTVLLASFLLVRKVEPDTKFPLELAADVAPKTKSKQSKSKKKDKSKAAEPNSAEPNATDSKESQDTKVATDQADNSSIKEKTQPETTGEDGAATATGGAATSTKDKPSTSKESENLKEYYQPITMRFYSSKPATLEPFARIVKPAAEVRKYMEEVMERAERAPAGFLPFRLPREENNNHAGSVDEANNNNEVPYGTHASNAPAAVRLASEDGTSRTRDGNSVVASVRDPAEGLDSAEDMEPDDLEFLLKDHYDAPNGLVPIRA